MDHLTFSVLEILSLIGIAQCIYIVIYMVFRSGRISRAGLPLVYFSVLCMAFLSDFGQVYIGELRYYYYLQWAAWFLGPPLSVLLIIQIAQINKVPDLKHYWVLALIPLALGLSFIVGQADDESCSRLLPCEERQSWLAVGGIVAGAISLLTISVNWGFLDNIASQKAGKERYWLILTLVITNMAFLAVMFASLNPDIEYDTIVAFRVTLGLALVYLVSTSLFRIYPQAVRVSDRMSSDLLSEDEKKLAKKVEDLLSLQKVYQEPTYSRTDLARECSTSETSISRIINIHFEKSFPQLMNEHRVADAKRLLRETNANVKTVAEEVGFNSIASFNRVFKDFSGYTPSQYRKKAA